VRILYPVHQYLPRHTGGVEVYTHSLARTMARSHDVLVYCHEAALDGGALRHTEEEHEGVPVRRVAAYVAGEGRPGPWRTFSQGFQNRAILRDFVQTLGAFRPDVVHVQHLKDLSVGIPEASARVGVPVVMTLHDYWTLCANAQRVRPGGAICRGTHWWMECGRCAAHRIGSPALGLTAPLMAPLFWRRDRAVRGAVDRVSLLISPSAFLRDRLVEAGFPRGKICVLEHGLEPGRLGNLANRHERAPAGRPGFRGHYAYIGSLAWQKGVHILVEAFAGLGAEDAELRVWGDPAVFPDYSGRLREVAGRCPRIRLEGPLPSGRVGDALAWADYLVVPSLWWENSPMTILEAYRAGVPVIASRLGALVEKVADGVSGLLFAPGDVADLRRVLRYTWERPDLLNGLRRALPRVKTMDEHARTMEDVYRQLLSARGSW